MPEPVLSTRTAQPFAFLSRSCPVSDIGPTMQQSFARLGAAFATAGAAPMGPPLAHFWRIENGSAVFDVGFPASPEAADGLRAAGLSFGQTAAGKAMTATHVGSYAQLQQTYDAVFAEMRRRGLEPASDMWEAYLSPPETAPEQVRTEVIWPVRPAGA